MPVHALQAAPKPTREIFGYALGSSLGNAEWGYPSWNFSLLSTVAYFGIHINAIKGKDQLIKADGPNPFDNVCLAVSGDGTKATPTKQTQRQAGDKTYETWAAPFYLATPDFSVFSNPARATFGPT